MDPRFSRPALALLLVLAVHYLPATTTAIPQHDIPGLVDHPFLGDTVTYLDSFHDGQPGNAWTAWTTSSPPSSACDFKSDVDYDHGTTGGDVAASNQDECCALCAADASCAAGVFVKGKCWKKTQAQLAKPSTVKGTVACAPLTRPPPASWGPGPDSLKMKANVPGDLLTDLQSAGLIGDPLYEMNFLNNSLWEDEQWTYGTEFELPATTSGESRESESRRSGNDGAATWVLVLDGVKMGAHVAVNGVELGTVDDQFLRYRFPISADALAAAPGAKHNLTVTFDSSIDCHGRWMACTGGWDWAPYSQTSQGGAATFSKGIWKSVSLVQVGSAAMVHVVPHVFYEGAYPTAPLQDGAHAPFKVMVRVVMWAPAATRGTIHVSGAWDSSAASDTGVIDLPAGESAHNLTLTAAAKDIKLWWPAGAGGQPRYAVSASFSPSSGKTLTAQDRLIGFRHFAIVTGNDTDPAYVANATGAEGTSNNGMLFRVNGAPIFARGANMIPMEELEGRMRADAHRQLVRSAADAGFNMLRNWGGGIFLPDAWYEACDALGVMVYHDMQFAQNGHSPAQTPTQEAEFRHQARRLSHHPSIVIWDGCNECRVDNDPGSTAIYADFVLQVMAEEDRSRSVWPACPAAGWAQGVDRLTSRPNGNKLVTKYEATLETHGPYQHGNGWIAANHGGFSATANPVPTNLAVPKGPTGPQYPNIFASEFGSVVMSSFESMSPTLAPAHWGLHGGAPDERCTAPGPCDGKNAMAERNYDCDPLISKFFGAEAASVAVLNTTGEVAFKRQLYQCQLAQALEMKSNIEHRRSGNTFGILVWQFNEIWPTGGWGSVEYGTPVAGQVLGGRWKPLHYLYESHLYADVMCACSTTVCYVKNDGITPFKGTATLTSFDLTTGKQGTPLHTEQLDLAAGAGITHWFSIDTSKLDLSSQGVAIRVMGAAPGKLQTLASHNIATLALPQALAKTLQAHKANVKATVVGRSSSSNSNDAEDGSYTIQVTSDRLAMYVVLTTQAQGRFEQSLFNVGPDAPVTLKFIPFVSEDQGDILRRTLRVEDLSNNL